ncbi:hypothetical protein niasHS_007938 [Heterodera schachtii]|uniref:CBM21 domain-containing protein n=1 Tax=Heterodera schachtii TaxID=97005 RepID=A0ABD2JQ44_HETSC
MMGIECVRSTAPRPWDSESERFHQVHHSSDGYGRDGIGTHPSMSGDATATVILPHSAPSSSCGFGSRRAASFPLASAVLISAHLPSSHAAKIYQQQQMAAGNLKVRSQSESAALNKLVQLNNTQHKPRHFLDEFEIWRNRKSGNGAAQSGMASAGPPAVGSGREVKFFGEPHPLQSDSEGEDSLVSPDEEVSPSGSCAEEEEEEEDEQQHQDGTGPPMLNVLDELVGQLEGLDIDQQQEHKMGLSDHLHQQQHHQPMPPAPRYADSLLDNISLVPSDSGSACLYAGANNVCAAAMPMASPFQQSLPPSSLVEPPSSDYMTVPSMLASVDLAMPAEPSPLVQLPFQVPLLNVELCHRRPSFDGSVVPPQLPQPPSLMANNSNAGSETAADEPSPPALFEHNGTAAFCPDDIKSGTVASIDILPPSETTPAICSGHIGIGTISAETLSFPLVVAALRPLKRVRFADDCGQCLETVRVMTEPSDYPPKISPAVLRRIRRAAAAASSAIAAAHSAGGTDANGQPLRNSISASAIAIEEMDSDELDEFEAEEERQRKGGPIHRRSWKMAFKQPASEYVHFRDTLDRQRVALENVMLKNELSRMVGTIKVANMAFEKHVFVRHTANGWKTFSDVEAQWQCSPSKAFDTFRFDVPLPRNNECPFIRFEFCVRFLAGSSPSVEEHWDSNDGKNFVLLSQDQFPTTMTASSSSPVLAPSQPSFLALSHQSPTTAAHRLWTTTPKSGGIGISTAKPSASSPFLVDINHNNTGGGVGKTAPYGRSSSSPMQIERCVGTGICDRDDPYRVDWNSPNGLSSTTFASWKQLTTDGPYW